jgi:hypothetical protein
VQHMISNFNHVSMWVPIAVLTEPKVSQRARILDKFIKMAAVNSLAIPLVLTCSYLFFPFQHLRDLNNFHLLTAVLSGINNSAVLRLKWSFARVPKRSKQVRHIITTEFIIANGFSDFN